jgi:site-specific recombinase XerD
MPRVSHISRVPDKLRNKLTMPLFTLEIVRMVWRMPRRRAIASKCCAIRCRTSPLSSQISPEDVQRYVASKQQEGRVQPKTVNNTLVPLKEMFMHAVRWGYLRENPALYVEKPRVLHREMYFFTKNEPSADAY